MFKPRGDTWDAGDYLKVYLAVNDSTVHEAWTAAPGSGSTEEISITCSALLNLSSGNTVQVYVRSEIDATVEFGSSKSFLSISKAV